MSTTRTLLDCLGRDSLVRLIVARGLPRSRENDERRETLARSYRGDVAALINDLTHAELVDVFRQLSFHVDGEDCYLSNPGKYRRDELRLFAARAFAEQDVELPAPFSRIEPEEPLDDLEADDAGMIDDGETDDGEADDRPFGTVSAAWSRPRKLARVMRRLGWRVPERLRTERFQQLIMELRALGLEVCLADDRQASVLDETAESPGIAARIRLRRPHSPTGGLDAEHAEEEVDLSDAHLLLAHEKIAHLALKRDPGLLYFVKENSIWAATRAEANQPKPRARRIASLDLSLDHDHFVYYIDGDGDLARRERDATRDAADPTLSLLGWAVIHSDGVVDPREVAELRRSLKGSGQTDNAAGRELATLDAAITVACTAPRVVKERLVGQLFKIATADRQLADEEAALLKMIEQRLLPGSEKLTTLIEEWRAEHLQSVEPQTRGDQLIDDILSLLQTSTQWQN